MGNVKAIRSESLSKPYDYRYVIVDIDTGEILDDAQGYGYRTAQKAYAGYNYWIDSAGADRNTYNASQDARKRFGRIQK